MVADNIKVLKIRAFGGWCRFAFRCMSDSFNDLGNFREWCKKEFDNQKSTIILVRYSGTFLVDQDRFGFDIYFYRIEDAMQFKLMFE